MKALNLAGAVFVYRVRNMGTFDPIRKVYRRHSDHEAIPDICGYAKPTHTKVKPGTAVFIEVKYVAKVENKTKLRFAVKTTDEQRLFLLRAYRCGALVGYAYNLEDCLAIVHNDPDHYPRHPRTWAFLPEEEWAQKEVEYREKKKVLAKLNQDPLARDIGLAIPDELKK